LEGDLVPNIKIGDIVTRKSYGGDIYFRVDNIVGDQGQERAVLRGLVYRLCADAPLKDLERKDQITVDLHRKENLKKQRQQIIRVASRQGRGAERAYNKL
jgi:spore coat assembly protein